MPLAGLYCSATDTKMTLEEGVEHFEAIGHMPAEAIWAMVKGAQKDSHDGVHARLSPSSCDPETTCGREIYLKRFTDYYLDPLVLWEAMEGTLWHDVFESAGADIGGNWKQEAQVPEEGDNETVLDPDDGHPVVEVFPGVFMSGRVDKHNDVILTDFKTSKYPRVYGKKPPKDFGLISAQKGWAIQENLYRIMLEKAKGLEIKDLFVWRMYRGSHDRTLTFKKYEIPIMHPNTIWKVIGDFVTETVKHLKKGVELVRSGATDEEVEAYAKEIRMDGWEDKMFNGKKCSQYCSVREKCFKIQGMVDF